MRHPHVLYYGESFMTFKDITIEDRDWILNILEKSECPSLEYNFTTLFIWSKIYDTKVLEHNGFLHCMSGKESKAFLFPAGSGDLKTETDFLINYAKENKFKVRFHSLSVKNVEFLNTHYPEMFEFIEDRNSGDYVYSADSLATLTGKKLAAKRNHINRFLENYPEWEYVPITRDNIEEADKMHDEWCKESGCRQSPGLANEACAVKCALKYFEELKLTGAMLKTRDGVCAFTVGDKLNDKTFLVHIEKAFADVQGAYPMINKQFVLNAGAGYEFINREEDTGDEGLRKAKLSYRPVEIIKKFNAKEI